MLGYHVMTVDRLIEAIQTNEEIYSMVAVMLEFLSLPSRSL